MLTISRKILWWPGLHPACPPFTCPSLPSISSGYLLPIPHSVRLLSPIRVIIVINVSLNSLSCLGRRARHTCLAVVSPKLHVSSR